MQENVDTNVSEKKDAPSDERILFFREPCERLKGETCSRCATVCPASAISFADSGEPVIDNALCTRCGICIGVCDSFASNRITTVDHAKRMERKAKATGRLYLCCKEDVFEGLEPAANVVVLGCLSALSPEFTTYLLSTGIEVVLCHDLAYCENCARGGSFGGRLWQRAFLLAQEWSGRQIGSTDAIPETEHLMQKMAAPDRRTLFTGAIGAVGEVASGEYRARKSTVVEDFLARREQMRAESHGNAEAGLFLDEDSRRQSEQSRFARKLLLEEAIAKDPSIAERKG